MIAVVATERPTVVALARSQAARGREAAPRERTCAALRRLGGRKHVAEL